VCRRAGATGGTAVEWLRVIVLQMDGDRSRDVRRLPRVVASLPGKPQRPNAADNQRAMALVARDETRWNSEMAMSMESRFDELAETWDAERGSYRLTPLEDALNRGGPFPDGLCVEVGAGTGVLTRRLALQWSQLVAIDLSYGMLRRSPHPWRIKADAARLPIADGRAMVLVIGDAPLFAHETARVLAVGGALIWTNALGVHAPFFLPSKVLLESLQTAGGQWHGVASAAGWGSWVVLRRTG
jgi:methyltransferase family protein